MTARKKVTDAEIAQALRDHFNVRGHAAKALGISAQRVQNYADAAKVPPAWIQYEKRKDCKESAILKALAENGNDRVAAARVTGANLGSVYRWARRNNVPPAPDSRKNVERKPLTMPLVRWTPVNVAKLRDLCLQVPPLTKAQMAAAFGSTESSIQTAVSRHGFTRFNVKADALHPQYQKPAHGKVRRDRDCLICDKPFLSEGAHNRQCPSCWAVNSEMAA